MSIHSVVQQSRRTTTVAVVLMFAMTACAGDVGKYRNEAVAVQNGNTSAAGTGSIPNGAIPVPTGSAVPGAGPNSAPGGSSQLGPVTGPAQAGAGPVVPGTSASGSNASGSGSNNAGSAPAGAGSKVGVTNDTITLGLVYPETGAYAGIARQWPQAMQSAFNEAGPINGRKVVLKTYDDGTSDAATIQASEKQAQGEDFAVMSVVSESNVVLAPLANRDGLPALVGNVDQKVAEPLRYAFAMSTYWARQAALLPAYIKNVLKHSDKKIGIVYETTSVAEDAKNAFKAKAKSLGMNVVYEQPISQSQSTCVNESANLQSSGAQLVFMMNGPLGAICMLRDSQSIGYKPIWTGVGTSWNFDVVATAVGGAANGAQVLGSGTTLDTPAGKHYAALMQKDGVSGADTDDITMIAYDLARSMITALQRTGANLGRESFVNTMETKMTGYDSGYLPPPTFGPNDRSGPLGVAAESCVNGHFTTPHPAWHTSF